MTDTMTNITTALASVTTALSSLTREINHTRGLASALEDRIKALEALADAHPLVPSTTEILRARQLTTFERVARPVRDGQW